MFLLFLVRFGLLGGHAFGRWLLTRLAVCSLYVLAVYGFDCFSFWFWGLYVGSGSFGCLCILFTFIDEN